MAAPGQVSNDGYGVGCTVAGGTLGNASRYNLFAVGGLLAYNFGPATASVWATKEVIANATNSAAIAAGAPDPSLITSGFRLKGYLSFRIWSPDDEPAQPLTYLLCIPCCNGIEICRGVVMYRQQ